MKRLILVLLLAGCATATPNQSAIDATYTSYQALDQAILAADAAVRAGTLKGQDARNTLTALTTAKTGLDTALTVMKAATPASGATR